VYLLLQRNLAPKVAAHRYGWIIAVICSVELMRWQQSSTNPPRTPRNPGSVATSVTQVNPFLSSFDFSINKMEMGEYFYWYDRRGGA
jgi:hypothetical protein